jgi:outer membrane protein OmpA-like peptidoglycan-associated protein
MQFKMAIQLRQFSLGVICLMTQMIVAQPVIKLINPSFEDVPQAGHTPKGWIDCGSPTETPPDVQPSVFQVGQPPQHGQTYLGLVVRDNDTWEAVTQSLSSPLLQGQTYKFSLNLCRSTLYVSKSRLTDKNVNYATPIIVRIWGEDIPCANTVKTAKKEILAETDPVELDDWKIYRFQFQPKQTYHYIRIEAFYKIPTIFPYNGNILIDNASDIVPIVGEEAERREQERREQERRERERREREQQEREQRERKDTFKKGDVFEIEDLHFRDGSDTIQQNAFPTLKKLTELLKRNPKAVIEIGGHTNGLPKPNYCDSLSLGRANSVRDYLIERGIKPTRLKAKGYGKRQLKAKDDTREGRLKNQRVEIKILRLND